MSWALSEFCVVQRRYVLRWVILAIVFAWRCFLILSLISILAGLLSYDAGIFCTLGVNMVAIGLSIVAVWIGVAVLVRGIGSFTLGLGTASSSSVSPCGGFSICSNVTHLV
jgi:hypothetical protein